VLSADSIEYSVFMTVGRSLILLEKVGNQVITSDLEFGWNWSEEFFILSKSV
jgi:hypothetical protein